MNGTRTLSSIYIYIYTYIYIYVHYLKRNEHVYKILGTIQLAQLFHCGCFRLQEMRGRCCKPRLVRILSFHLFQNCVKLVAWIGLLIIHVFLPGHPEGLPTCCIHLATVRGLLSTLSRLSLGTQERNLCS